MSSVKKRFSEQISILKMIELGNLKDSDINKEICIFGVLIGFKEPTKSKGTDYVASITITGILFNFI